MRPCMPRLVFTTTLLALVLTGCGRAGGVDSDGDGLSDRQEARIGTDPTNPDTNCNGIPDGEDPAPLGATRLTLTAGPVTRVDDPEKGRCAKLTATVRGADGQLVVQQAVDIAVDGDAVPLEVVAGEDGSYDATLCVPGRRDVRVVATYRPPSSCDWARDSLVIGFGSDLPQPGVNTQEGEGDGRLTVFALDADTVGFPDSSPLPFAGATVLVGTADGRSLTRTTGDDGRALFELADAARPFDVTVGVEGFRFVTYMGLDAHTVAVALVPLDPVLPRDASRVGTIAGEVRGFLGEYAPGVPRFPPGNLVINVASGDNESEAPLAIVQLAPRNRPLSSVSMGSILAAPPGPIPIPRNMAYCLLGPERDATCTATYGLADVPEGQYLLFALGGTASHTGDAMADPYQLWFRPRALGITRVRVHGGETTVADIPMTIDLRPDAGTSVDVFLDRPPRDWWTGETLGNVLAMPVVHTGGEGFVFMALDGSFNHTGFDPTTQPLPVRFPADDDPAIRALGLHLRQVAVGLAGRPTIGGADRPGDSRAMRAGDLGRTVRLDSADSWLEVPHVTSPRPPEDRGRPPYELPLDLVSPDLFTGTIAWEPVVRPRAPDLYVVRLNYMTPAPRNLMADERDPVTREVTRVGSLGGPVAHGLWEILLPGDRTELVLPVFPDTAAARPLVANPAPSPTTYDDDGDEILRPQHYGPRTIELELDAYVLEAGDTPFSYRDGFRHDDLELRCAMASQDSFVVETP